MITTHSGGFYLSNGQILDEKSGRAEGLPTPEKARAYTMSYAILQAHNASGKQDGCDGYNGYDGYNGCDS